jgi:glycosyltransferase involved in cell wall biosynthesis
MRILTYTSLFPNPQQPMLGIFIYQRVVSFSHQPGKSVTVLAPVPYSPSWFPLERSRKFSQIPKQELTGSLGVFHPRYLLFPKVSMPLHGLMMFLGSVGLAKRLHQDAAFDCIDAHYVYPDGLAAILLGKTLGIPVFLSVRGTDINVFPSFRTIRPMVRWSLNKAAGIITVSLALRDAVKRLGISEERVRVISNGVDTDRFHPRNQMEARHTLKVPPQARIVISVGGLAVHKGFLPLVRAAARLAAKIPDFRLYIIGEGPLRPEIEQLVRALGLESIVKIVGGCENELLRFWYSAADVSCLVSAREGLPNVVLESLACGTPVVATGVGGIPELLSSPEYGIIVQQTPESIAEGLGRALEANWNREKIASAGQSRTWETVAREVADYFDSCLAKMASLRR